MSKNKTSKLTRRDTRYSVSSGKVLAATIQIKADQDSGPATAKALDLSSHGAKLEVTVPMPERQAIEISLMPNGLNSTISTSGSTRWIRPVRENLWWLGVSFDEPINTEQMEFMAQQGFLDRRQDQREATDQGIVARCELSEAPVTMKLRNFSVGGIGIWSPREIRSQSRVLIAVGEKNLDGRPIVARVQWVRQEPDGEGYVAGCSFVAKESYPELRRQLAVRCDQKSGVKRKKSLRYMIGLVAGIAMLLLGISLFGGL